MPVDASTHLARPRASLTVVLLTGLTMLAFATNSLLARAAFQTTSIDAASFTAIRIGTGALALVLTLLARGERLRLRRRDGWSAWFLFVYAAAFPSRTATSARAPVP